MRRAVIDADRRLPGVQGIVSLGVKITVVVTGLGRLQLPVGGAIILIDFHIDGKKMLAAVPDELVLRFPAPTATHIVLRIEKALAAGLADDRRPCLIALYALDLRRDITFTSGLPFGF